MWELKERCSQCKFIDCLHCSVLYALLKPNDFLWDLWEPFSSSPSWKDLIDHLPCDWWSYVTKRKSPSAHLTHTPTVGDSGYSCSWAQQVLSHASSTVSPYQLTHKVHLQTKEKHIWGEANIVLSPPHYLLYKIFPSEVGKELCYY